MDIRLSIIIPNRNGRATIEKCLEAVFAAADDTVEVTVVDDSSEDNSAELIRKFPCRLIRLEKHAGASAARNIGAANSSGRVFFFTDADCLVQRDTLAIARRALAEAGSRVVVGGTYTREPFDAGFFGHFQSVFINYSETKDPARPDYLATHALAIDAETFRMAGGFSEDFLPILEDVEFSHRLRRLGYRLAMKPTMLVRHIFNFSFWKSLHNAARKSRYWTRYSLKNRDLFADSGTASVGLKVNVVSWFLGLLLLIASMVLRSDSFLYPLPFIIGLNAAINRGLFRAFQETKGTVFALLSYLYYTLIYPGAVGVGAIVGVVDFIFTPFGRGTRHT